MIPTQRPAERNSEDMRNSRFTCNHRFMHAEFCDGRRETRRQRWQEQDRRCRVPFMFHLFLKTGGLATAKCTSEVKCLLTYLAPVEASLLSRHPSRALLDLHRRCEFWPSPVDWPLHSKFFLPYQCQISFFFGFRLRFTEKSSMSHVPRRRLGQRPQPLSARAWVPGRGQSAGISRRLSGSKRRSLTERRTCRL